jgi:hypothetical protein
VEVEEVGEEVEERAKPLAEDKEVVDVVVVVVVVAVDVVVRAKARAREVYKTNLTGRANHVVLLFLDLNLNASSVAPKRVAAANLLLVLHSRSSIPSRLAKLIVLSFVI